MATKIERPTKFLERAWPWLLFALFVSFSFGACGGACALGPFEEVDTLRFGPNLRGYTAGGIMLGIGAVLFAFLTLWYSIRKRRDVAGSSMMSWLWSHVWFGIIAVFLATFHAGCGLVSANVSTGKVLFAVFGLLAGSGFIWRMMYATVPKKAAPLVLNYSRDGALRRAEEQLLEIEKLSAGKSAELHRIKDMLLARDVPPHELGAMAQSVTPNERAVLDEIILLAQSRRRALARPPLQERFTAAMHRWRKLHVPLAFLFVVMLFVHVFGAFDIVRKAIPFGVADSGPLSPFRPSPECRDCHTTIYDQWKDSMHAHALTSPLTLVQNNLDMRHSLKGLPSPDPRRVCINCHGPAVAAVTEGDFLPLRSNRQDEGIECVACHQLPEDVVPGGGALASAYQSRLVRGDRFLGPLTSPIGNAYHRSDSAALWKEPERLCATCHDVNYDKNGDGKIVKGTDLVLQTTFDEWREYQAAGGKSTCISCHMPATPKLKSAADGALVPFQMDYEGNARTVHDHSFAGVDYPLDTAAKRDPQRPKRQALLASAASFDVTVAAAGDNLVVKASIANQTGHSLPTGFAFARQMWIEITVKEGSRTLFQSGVIAKASDDLCDAGTFGETTNPLRPFVVGCATVDPNLVNIQLKLLDKIGVAEGSPANDPILAQPPDANETYLQFLTGGAVARKRPIDKANLAPLKVNEQKTFTYNIKLGGARNGTVAARLLFRNLPPYWVRAMAREQPPTEKPRLDPLVENIQTLVMAEKTVPFAR
jgi:hypothetical protein